MVIKVGINGFGRIGRVIFRTCLQNPDIELSAINDPAIDIEYICYLIKFDSTHGKFKGNITHTNNEINIDDLKIRFKTLSNIQATLLQLASHSHFLPKNLDRIVKIFRDKLPHTVPWQVAGVQYVVEASGMFTCLEKSSGHLASDGVKRVIVTAPSVDVPMIILGVNDDKLNPEQKVLSCASSTLYCLAPIVKVLEDNFGVAEGFITSIHAMTPSLKPLDGLCLRGKHWRDHRSIHQNIIPATTGSCKALAKIIPQVKDKMAGLAFRVPIVNVSVLDMTVRLDTNTNLQNIINTVENAGRTSLRNIIKISNEEAVSSDFSGDSHSCILDAASSLELKPNFYKIICWYENEYSYACRVIDSIFFSERQFNTPVRLPCKMTYVRAKLTKKQDVVQQTERCTQDKSSIQCNTDVPKCSSSVLETICKNKPPVRPVVLKKPLSSHNSGIPVTTPTANRDTKKRNELFKIWNDNNDAQKSAVRQQRSSFFQSCMAFAPKKAEIIDCMKPQERLENVKKEFSKMVNITEDLLKKSYGSKLHLGRAPKSSEGVKLGGKGESKDSKTNINPPTNNSICGICGDYKNRLSASPNDCSNEAERCCSSSDRNDDNSEYQLASAVRKIVIDKPYLIPSREKITSLTKQNPITDFGLKVENNLSAKVHDSLKLNSKFNATMNIRAPMTKKDNHFKNNLSNKSPGQSATKDQKRNTKSCDTAVKQYVEEKKMEIKIAEGSASPHVSTETNASIRQELDTPEQIPQKEFEDYFQRKDYNMRIIDEALQKRNITLVNSDLSNQSNNSELNCLSSDISGEQMVLETETSEKNINKQILETLNTKVQKVNNSELNCKSSNISSEQSIMETEIRGKKLNKLILDTLNKRIPGPVIIVPEDTSGGVEPERIAKTVSSAASTRMKLDLYDKLDSASATNSTNSFEINERKSQVIQICDLTNSVEDLTRLDKICRIIEISDELSDKLFSTLDQTEFTGMKQKTWSFRDLCERIQLDEFCNKVFGKGRI